ncbi:hypothetical protein CANINC_003166 [Pichia inconspicua]|uniref:DNA mismatch repair protein n=1 Tax=Pichia inconspicua TaxID=52247 RepID=A0A4V6TTQ9_9ASCO|nr:hypothetical protein CANINC_003166 [[Candida] inconspicua]
MSVDSSKKMKQASLMSFFTKKKVQKPASQSTNDVPVQVDSITPDNSVAEIAFKHKLNTPANEKKILETPKSLKTKDVKNADTSITPSKITTTAPAISEVPSSPVVMNRKSRKINYSELSDDDEDDIVAVTKKKRRTIAWDDIDDDDFRVDDAVADEDDEDFIIDEKSHKEELDELNDKSIVDEAHEPAPKSSPPRNKISSILSSKSKTQFKTSSAKLTPQKKFNKENEERYHWLVTLKDADGHLETDPDYDPRTLFIPQSAWDKFTAFEKQYWSIKSKMWDTVVFFKKGKFFELYEKDADIAHSKFDLKLAGTGRANMRLAGVPEMSFDYWAKRFIDAGYKVAKVDQKESMLAKEIREKQGDSKSDKESKVIQRELAYILTCGTLIDENLLNDESSKYCLALKEKIDYANNIKTFGVCFVDVSTGSFQILEFNDDFECSKLETLLSQINPMEVLIPKNELDSHTLRILKFNSHPSASFNFIKPETEFWDHEKTIDELSAFTTEHDLKTPDILNSYYKNERFNALSAFGGVFWYLRSLKLDVSIISMGNFKEYDPFNKALLNSSMRLDGVTLQNLEIFNNSFDQSDRGTLFKVLNKGVTSFGKRMFKSWVIHPLLNKDAIEDRLDSVESLLNDGDIKYLLESKLKKLCDVERMLTRIHSKTLKPKDFVRVIESFEVISELINALSANVDNLRGLLKSIVVEFPLLELEELLENWNGKFDKSLAINEGVIVPNEGVDEEFDESNNKITTLEKKLEDLLSEYRSEYRSSEIVYKDSGKEIYLIEVPMKIVGKIPHDWQQMAATSKCKRYWSPEVRTLAKELMEVKELHKMICMNLKDKIYANFDKSYEKCMKIVQSVAKMDCVLSLARASEALGFPMCRPEIVDSEYSLIDFKQLRHPCFLPGSGILRTKDFIPNDIALGLDNKNRIGLLTGANAAGKSTLLRMSCVATIMAQIGCFLPAESARLTPIDAIMTRLGANDNIMQGKSTFYVELLETKKMLDNATPRSLVVLDELGRGGSSSDGFAIAEAVLHHFATHIQSLGFFATHYASLGDAFVHHRQVVPLRMAILADAASKKLTFLYTLEHGKSHGSFGMHVAAMCGIPEKIVERATVAAERWERESRRGLSQSTTVDGNSIPLGIESDWSWWSQGKKITSFGPSYEKETLRSVFEMIENL